MQTINGQRLGERSWKFEFTKTGRTINIEPSLKLVDYYKVTSDIFGNLGEFTEEELPRLKDYHLSFITNLGDEQKKTFLV